MASLYANENFPLRVVQELRVLGHDVLTSSEAGRANQRVPDEEVLHFATEEKRAVLTLNRLDFFRLHRSTQGLHEGIIACTRDDANPVEFAHRIHAAIQAMASLQGLLIRVVRPSY
jgi:predicted nuclease of predicted toxin-antitoxin system